MGQRTAQLLTMLRTWCEQERGRQTQVAKILEVGPSTVADWLSGRRQFTGEQSLAVQDFLRTVYATPRSDTMLETEGPLSEPGQDSIQKLHAGLEQPDKKNVWIRTLGQYHHVILGGTNKDAALKAIVDFLRSAR
jgi:transcriptional regulator with XRE-family HTH domain